MMKSLSEIKTKNNFLSSSIYCFILVLILISALRIPYVGQFFDSTIFSFLFGYSKYILYIYLIIVMCFKIFNLKIKAIYQKRFILMILMCTSLFSVILGGIEIIVHHNNTDILNFYIHNVWYETLWNFNNYFVFGVSGFVDGGFIGTLLASVSGIFLILFSLLLFTLIYFYIFKSQWESVKVKTIKTFNKLKQLKQKRNWNNKKSNYLDTLIDEQKRSNLNLDEITENKVNIDNEISLLSNFLKDNDIIFSKIENYETPTNQCLSIKTSNDQLAKIHSLIESFKMIGLNDDYRLISTDEIFRIEYPLNRPLINHILRKLLNVNVSIPLDIPIALYDNQKFINFNLKTDYTIGIFDIKNINIINFINILITSISAHYKKENILIFYLDPLGKNQHLIKTDLFNSEHILGLINMRNYFARLKNTIDNLKREMTKHKITNIYELNNNPLEIYKNKIIIIDNMNIIHDEDMYLYKEICELLKHANNYGLTFVIADNSNNAITYDEIKYQLIIGFAMESKLSKKLFDTSAAHGIQKWNEAIFAKLDDKLKIKVVIPNISNIEITLLENKFSKL